jgi:tubulin polyglutamylase TTLL4
MKAVRELRNMNHQMVDNPIEVSSAPMQDGRGGKEQQKKSVRKTSAKKKREEELDGNDNEENMDDDEEDGKDEDEESHYRDPPPGYIRLRPSIIPDLFPSTIYVEYPQELGIKRNDINVLEPIGERKMLYKSYWERICIRNAFKRAGFEKSNTNKYWTALWSKHQNSEILQNLQCIQKVNHFPASWCVGRKDRLARTMNTMKRLHGKEFDYHPDTFIMPNDRDSFQRIFKTEQGQANNNSHSKKKPKESLWIVKPVASSCGRGISVHTISEAVKIAAKRKVLVQRYLKNPYLINGKKFDLRIYILVSGVDPLRVYVHEEGLTRISTSDFSLKNISNRFAHLTNYSVNKKADNFKAASFDFEHSNQQQQQSSEQDQSTKEGNNTTTKDEPLDMHIPGETEGFKWSLSAFRRWLTAKEGKAKMEETFAKIHDICLKTMIAAEGEITPQLQSTVGYRTNCFELFGCDVILDEDLTPHLLEVNVSPSLMGSSPLDKRIKGMLIADILHTVGMYPYDSTLMKKYSMEEEATSFTTSTNGIEHNNPFAFSNLTKLMANQGKLCSLPISFHLSR